MVESIIPVIAERGHRKERVGEVLTSKMAKTIVVRVQRRFPHPRFKKVVTQFNKFYVHDEKAEAKPGDRVRIVETRPLSKTKRWRLVEIIERNADAAPVAVNFDPSPPSTPLTPKGPIGVRAGGLEGGEGTLLH